MISFLNLIMEHESKKCTNNKIIRNKTIMVQIPGKFSKSK